MADELLDWTDLAHVTGYGYRDIGDLEALLCRLPVPALQLAGALARLAPGADYASVAAELGCTPDSVGLTATVETLRTERLASVSDDTIHLAPPLRDVLSHPLTPLGLADPDGYGAFVPEAPAIASIPVDPTAVAREAAAVGTTVVEDVTSLLATVDADPPALLKAGGVGVRELRRLGRAAGLSEQRTRQWLTLAHCAGLVQPMLAVDGHGGELLPTSAYDAWRACEPADRLAPLLAAWPETPLADRGAALTRAQQEHHDPVLRQLALTYAATVACDHGVTDLSTLAEALRWCFPLILGTGDGLADALAQVWEQARTVGLVAHDAVSPLGAALLADEPDALTAACRALLPAGTTHATLQADLTALVPGIPAPALAALLDRAAERQQGGGGAVTWRFTRASVRRALDAGYTPEQLTESLQEYATGGALPQPLRYLIGDVGRRHGTVRVRPAGCVLRTADDSLAAELVHARTLQSLGLTQWGPQALVADAPPATVLAALRDAGYAPVAEDAHGQTTVTRDEPRRAPAPEAPLTIPWQPGGDVDDGLADDRLVDLGVANGVDPSSVHQALMFTAGQLTPSEQGTLAMAVATQKPVTLDYTDAGGEHTTRVVECAQLHDQYLVAWCQLRNAERHFHLSRIRAVRQS